MRPHTEIIPDALVELTRLPRARVVTALRVLKDAGRIAAGRPYAPPFSDRCVARIVSGLAAPVRRQVIPYCDGSHRTSASGITGEELLAGIASGAVPAVGTIVISDDGIELVDTAWQPADCRSAFFIAAETIAAIASRIKEIQCSQR